MNKKIISVVLIMLISLCSVNMFASSAEPAETKQEKVEYESKTLVELVSSFYQTTGINALTNPRDDLMTSEARPSNKFSFTMIWSSMFQLSRNK